MDASAQPPAPTEAITGLVRELVRELSGERAGEGVHADADLARELGLGSLERVELALRIEERFGVALPDAASHASTPRELAVFVLAAANTAPAREKPRGAAAPGTVRTTSRLDVTRFRSIPEALVARADEDPDRPHAFFREGESDERVVTRGELARQAASVARTLRARGLRPGETAALMLPTGEPFLAAFAGIQLAGGVPVPLYPPLRGDRVATFARRQRAILENAGARQLVLPATGDETAAALAAALPSSIALVAFPELLGAGGQDPLPAPSPTDVALVQYTSGSTGTPRGVALDHGALLANIRAIGDAVSVGPNDVVVSWLPLYHDMGLVGSWLFSLVHGIPIVLIPPASFLVRPERWLRAVSEHRGTLSAAPNFAWELCARRIPDDALAGIDLSSWRQALDGAEPVLPATIELFANRFASHGFRRESLRPVYGLAECAVALAFAPDGRGARVLDVEREPFESQGRVVPAGAESERPLSFVSVGTALPGHRIAIVDDEGQPLPARTEGRIVFDGPSRMRGFHRNPEATAAVTVRLADGEWIDTGDLGFVDDGGELFVTGRRKDLIIRGGRNLVPAEIEGAARSVDGVREAAAVGVPSELLGTERLVIVVESRLRGDLRIARMRTEIVGAVHSAIGLPPDDVQVVRPGELPRTSSGKLRRGEIRAGVAAGSLVSPDGEPGDEVPPPPKRPGRSRFAAEDAVRVARFAALMATAAILVPAASLALRFVPRSVVGSWTRWICRRLLGAAGLPVRVTGLERLPVGGAILVPNHGSYADVVVLLAVLPGAPRFVSKQESFRWPFVGSFLRRGGHLGVARSDRASSLSAASELERAVADGETVVVFPEGTFTRVAGVRPLRLGAFTAAVATGRPLVPIGLVGVRARLPDHDWIPHPGRVEVHVGGALVPGESGWNEVLRLRDATRAALVELSGEPALDLSVPAAPPSP